MSTTPKCLNSHVRLVRKWFERCKLFCSHFSALFFLRLSKTSVNEPLALHSMLPSILYSEIKLWGTLPKRHSVQRPPADVEQIFCIDLWQSSSTIFWRPARFLHWENAQQQHRHRHRPDGVQARGKHTQTCAHHRETLFPKGL